MKRRELEDAILNRRAVRMQADEWADDFPIAVYLSPADLDEVLVDDDPDRQWHVEPGLGRRGNKFMSIPMFMDVRMHDGHVRLDWARPLKGDL